MFNPEMVATLHGALAKARAGEPQARPAAPGAFGGGATTAFNTPKPKEVFEPAAPETGFSFEGEPPQLAGADLAALGLSLEDADHFVFGAAA